MTGATSSSSRTTVASGKTGRVRPRPRSDSRSSRSNWRWSSWMLAFVWCRSAIHGFVAAQDLLLDDVDEYACDPVPTELSDRSLVLSVSGNDTEWLLYSRRLAFQQLVLETYNEWSFEACDYPHFRTMQQVNVSSLDILLLEQQQHDNINLLNKTTTTSLVTLAVAATCRNCTEALSLFFAPPPILAYDNDNDNDNTNDTTSAQERAAPLQTKTISSSRQASTTGNDANSCVCPATLQTSSTLSASRSSSIEAYQRTDITASTSQSRQGSTSSSSSSYTGTTEEDELTRQGFVDRLNQALSVHPEFAAEDLTVLAVEELRQVTCGAVLRPFTSFAYLDVELGQELPSSEEVAALEESFATAYNQLSFATCDPFHRTVLRANLQFQVDQEEYEYEDLEDDDRVRQRHLAVITNKQRQLVEDEEAFLMFHNVTNLTTCTCPATPILGDEGDDGLSQEDFLDVFHSDIEELQQEGTLSESIQVAEDSLEEGQQVPCLGASSTFGSQVFSDLQVDLLTITLQEAQRLEQAFADAYNRLVFETCDGNFRSIQAVELRIAPAAGNDLAGRRLQDVLNDFRDTLTTGNDVVNTDQEELFLNNNTAGNTNTSNTTEIRLSPSQNTTNATAHNNQTQDDRGSNTIAYFQVTGRCRNCPVTEAGGFSLFDDAFRRRERRLDHDSVFPPPPRRLQEALDVCLCPQGKEPGQEPPPSTDDFLVDFNDNLVKDAQEEAEEKEEILEEQDGTTPPATPYAVPVIVIEEVTVPPRRSDPFRVNTTSPTQAPTTDAPTSAPTPEPTTEPTPNPTNEPTAAPTNEPSPSPTGQPTFPPTQFPTFEPTPNPTAAPSASPSATNSAVPSFTPSSTPSVVPSMVPSIAPSVRPSATPSHAPSTVPSRIPSLAPTMQPTTTVCNEPFLDLQERVYITFSGNTQQQQDQYFTAVLLAASQPMNALSGCVPEVTAYDSFHAAISGPVDHSKCRAKYPPE
ncbi:Hemolysin-type calcium-binding repeat (2 copies) [Seminavis robusta]|uniref:Circumsporozoite protein n=1 Tax=Seminavis robusta TaxID=568900 RepID=A0A9N8EF68_9STRA|nr:Hemolysin-type calcium-binding repeat (2 copies) [Seminavis robusta]|eukprot:Sro911_g219210.1 Hemolysin-type calcium-binding repeat (2 copies) (976) ;mRNA; r:12619-16676